LHNAEVEPICRKYLELRYSLLPYNYTLLREACDTGVPPMRALWLHYPKDAEAAKLGDEYLWGRSLLIAPVVEQGVKSRRLYLPPGDWFDWWTGDKISGARWIERSTDLATMPIYVCAGAIVPLDPIRQYTAEKVSEPTTLRVYPGADGAFTLYDDDGASLDYQLGFGSWTRIRWDDRNRRLTIEPDSRSRMRSVAPRRFDISIVTTDARCSLDYGGKRVQLRL
jgi:alpha-glucosidase/alpha-D-xyloside xylohydrolase